MRRLVGGSVLLVCTCLAAGCGGSHVRLTALRAGGFRSPPLWLGRIIAREDKRLDDQDPHGPLSISSSKRRDVVDIFGEFKSRSSGRRGTSLRLVISPRMHRVLSATLSRQIAPDQAPPIARRSQRFLRIFPVRPGRTDCSIPLGGARLARTAVRGRCTTQFVSSPPYPRGGIRIRFGERWHFGGISHRAAWIVTVRLRDGRIQATSVTGQPPQLWK